MDNRKYGRIAAWVASGGWGFITLEDERGNLEKIWWHISLFTTKPEVEPRIGQQVSFTVQPYKLGKHRNAFDIEFVTQ